MLLLATHTVGLRSWVLRFMASDLAVPEGAHGSRGRPTMVAHTDVCGLDLGASKLYERVADRRLAAALSAPAR